MSKIKSLEAENEIMGSLFIINACMKYLGISMEEDKKSRMGKFGRNFLFCTFAFSICYHTLSDFIYICMVVKDDFKLENIIRYMHLVGYGYLSIIKLHTVWSKRFIFNKLIHELIEIWPIIALNAESQAVKEWKLKILRLQHIGYLIGTALAMVFYSTSPITFYLFELWKEKNPTLGFIWACWYPFDKHSTIGHIFVYLFEIFIGYTCNLITMTSELLFTAFANHIGILIRTLQIRLRKLGSEKGVDYYREISDNLKLHQRLIRFCGDVEEAYTVMNFNNVVISSISICGLVFIIMLLEPVLYITNKIFIVGYVLQIFILCWYADDIYYANAEIAEAAYAGEWYNLDLQSKKMLIILILRAQKPLGFTSLKFTIITLTTFSGIMSRSYSYFTLLYTMFTK